MRLSFSHLLLVPFLLAAESNSPQIESGPPASPLLWTEIPSTQGREKPSLDYAVLGSSRAPTSAKLVEFEDKRPYGDRTHRTVWLTHFDSLPASTPPADNATSKAVSLLLAFDATSGHLVCAFTPPTPQWVRSNEETWDIQARQGWKLQPAQYESLRSNVMDVWELLWSQGFDHQSAGQVIIRPRFNRTKILENSEPAPSNVWIVEVLGRFIMERYGHVLTTRVYVYRDGDLQGLFGAMAP